MKAEEKLQLFADIAVIKEKIEAMSEDLKPQIIKNTRFRVYVTGFFIILIAGSGLVLTGMRLTKEIRAEERIERVIK